MYSSTYLSTSGWASAAFSSLMELIHSPPDLIMSYFGHGRVRYIQECAKKQRRSNCWRGFKKQGKRTVVTAGTQEVTKNVAQGTGLLLPLRGRRSRGSPQNRWSPCPPNQANKLGSNPRTNVNVFYDEGGMRIKWCSIQQTLHGHPSAPLPCQTIRRYPRRPLLGSSTAGWCRAL